jgi:DNA gyrase subunit A
MSVITGRGSVKVRGRAVEVKGGGRYESSSIIVITEIPYQVNKSTMIEKIAELVRDKKIEGISNIRDESNQEGIRVVIELKKGAVGDVILNHLYKYTPLQSSFPVNTICINNDRPESMNMRGIFKAFFEFRQDVIRRRTLFLLNETRQKAHIFIGFCVAIDYIDKVIKIIRSSRDSTEAKSRLLSEEWPASESIMTIINLVSDRENSVKNGQFKFTEKQVKAIVEMRLSRLTGLEREALVSEIEKLGTEIQRYLVILSNKQEVIDIIINETDEVRRDYPCSRRTEILNIEDDDFDIEDFIEREDVILSLTANGYIKRTKINSYTSQNRGGKGKIGMATNDEDEVIRILKSSTHDFLLFFTNKNKVYRLKAYKIPEAMPNTKGRALVNLLSFSEGEKVENILKIPADCKDDLSIIFATKNGKIRRSSVDNFKNINANGKIAIDLEEGDKLIGVEFAEENQSVLLATKHGMSTRFNMSEELRVIKSRKSDGVIGMDLKDGDEVVSLCIIEDGDEGSDVKKAYLRLDDEFRFGIKNGNITDFDILEKVASVQKETNIELSLQQVKTLAQEEEILLSVSDDGYGKKTSAYHYRITGRGGKGVKNMNLDGNTVVGVRAVKEDSDIILMSTKGQTIRIPCKSISIVGRNTKGVKLFDLAHDEKVVSFEVC